MTRRINLKKRGFTVLEVTVAVSIIAILAGLLIYGIGHLTASGKANATGISLQNARNILQEFDQATALNRSVGSWPWIDIQSGKIYIAYGGAYPALNPLPANFWSSSVVYPVTTGVPPSSPMCAPIGAMTNDSNGFINRNGSYAVLYTQLAMRMVGGLSAAKSMMAALPSSSIMVPIFVSGAPYAPGNVVKSPMDNAYYRFTGPVWASTMTQAAFNVPVGSTGSSITADPSTDHGGPGANWAQLGPTETPDPIMLDAWGNPILMVPAAGLINVWTNCTKANGPLSPPEWPSGVAPTGTQLQAWASPLPTGQASATYLQPPITAPDNKPFFVSAGPDGDFTNGDDNIYSFNK